MEGPRICWFDRLFNAFSWKLIKIKIIALSFFFEPLYFLAVILDVRFSNESNEIGVLALDLHIHAVSIIISNFVLFKICIISPFVINRKVDESIEALKDRQMYFIGKWCFRPIGRFLGNLISDGIERVTGIKKSIR